MHPLTRHTLWPRFWSRRSPSYHIPHFRQTWPTATIFCFQNPNIIHLKKRYKSRNALGSVVNQYLMGVLIEEYKNCFQKWIDLLKRCIQLAEEYFEGQSKSKFNIYSKGETMKMTLILEQPSYIKIIKDIYRVALFSQFCFIGGPKFWNIYISKTHYAPNRLKKEIMIIIIRIMRL